MNITITHPELVATLVKPGEDIVKELTPKCLHQLRNVCSLLICAGNLFDLVKKRTIYRKEIDFDLILKELALISAASGNIKYPALVLDEKQLTPEKAHLLHMAIGVAGEGIELLDSVFQHVFLDKELDVENLKEELGDSEFYMEGIRQILTVGRQLILDMNISKLNKRYGELKYSNEQAIARKDKE